MRPLLGMWAGTGGGVPPDPTLDFGFEIPPSINGVPVAGEEITIDPGQTFGTYDTASYSLLLDGEQVAVGQGPFLIPTAWTGSLLRPRGVLRKGTQEASEVGSEIGPVVADFPDFAPPYHTAPTALGAATGADFDNAGSWRNTNVFAQAVNINGGGQIRQASHLGNYTAATITVSFGGSVDAPAVIQGVDAAFDPANATVLGIRTDPWIAGGVIGGEVYKINRSDHLALKNLRIQNTGTGIRFSAPIDDVLIEDVVISNARRGIENNHSSPETGATCTNVTIRNLQMPDGFAKQGIRFDYDSHDILITGNSAEDPMILDAQRQGPDGGCYGLDMRGTVHNLTVRFVHVYDCSSEQTDADFWDGDGFAAQGGCYSFLIDRCLGQGNADGGVDLKGGTLAAPHEVIDSRFFYNTWNMKAWDNINVRRCKFREPHKRGGTNAPHQIHVVARPSVAGSSHYLIEDCSFCDDRTTGVAFQVNFVGGISVPTETTVTIVNSSYSGGMNPVWDVVPGVTVIGAFIQGPVCNVAPTIVWEDEGGTPIDPGVGNYLRVVTSTSDWTGAATFEYQWRLDGEWVKFQTGIRMLATEDMAGKVIDCFVVGIHANGLHEGAKISDPASPILSIVVPNGYGFVEHSPQGTELAALTPGGVVSPPADRFEFSLDDTALGRLQDGGDTDGIMEVGATDTDFDDGDQEITVTMTDTTLEFDPISKQINVLVFKEFDELTRLISWAPAGNQSGIGHFGNAAPIQALPELLSDLVGQGEVGQSIRILGGGPGYTGIGRLIITTTPADEEHRIEIFGCTAAGLASGDTDKELNFDFTTPADQLSVAQRYASIDYANFINRDSYTTRLIGTRTPWERPKWCIFQAGTSGLNDFADGAAYTGYENLASAAYTNNQQVTYRAILPGTAVFEDGTGTIVNDVLVRPTTVRAGSNGTEKVDFPSPPDIFIRTLTWTNSYNGNVLFDFRQAAQFLTFHHLSIERFGRAAFLFENASSNGANNIILENMYCKNNQDVWWQDNIPIGGGPAILTIHDMTFRHILAEGYSKDFALLHGDSNNFLFEHCLLNSWWQDGDAYAKGITMDGTSHGVRCYRVLSLNTVDTTGASSGPKQGDGWIAEGPCYDIEHEECGAAGNCQGVDLKGITNPDILLGRQGIRLINSVYWDNQQNTKLWGVGNTATNVIRHDCYKHVTGGSGTNNIEQPPLGRAQWVQTGGSLSLYRGTHIGASNQRCRQKFISVDFFGPTDEILITNALGDVILDDCTINGTPVGLTDATTGAPVFAQAAAQGSGNAAVTNLGQWPAGIKKGQYCLMLFYRKGINNLLLHLPTQNFPDWDQWEIINEIQVGGGATATLLGRLMQGEMRGPWACGFEGMAGVSIIAAGFWNSVLRSGDAWEALTGASGVGGDIVWPDLTTLGANRAGVRLAGLGNDSARGTVPAGWTQRLSQGSTAGTDTGVVIDEKAIAVAGTEASASRTSTNPNWIAWNIALKPAVA